MNLRLSLILAATMAVCSVASADNIDLYSTGVTTPWYVGVTSLLAEGSADSHWSLVSAPGGYDSQPYVTITDGFPLGIWANNGAASQWIQPEPFGSGSAVAVSTDTHREGEYVYRTVFDLAGADPDSAAVSFRFGADNSVTDIRLNGVSSGLSGPTDTFVLGDLYTLSSGFGSGANTLDFVVRNDPGTVGNPTGLRVEIVGATASRAIPEPGTLALLALPLLGGALRIRRCR